MNEYHDKEWGVQVHDDSKLFEFMLLDAFQAGLSWMTVLRKRVNFKKAFDNFDVNKIAKYDTVKMSKLMQDEGIIRNKLKIKASVQNAIEFKKIQKEFGTFDKYIWQFVKGKPIVNKWKSLSQLPVRSKESDSMSVALKKRGFSFVGSTICYSFMQACGMVNDHVVVCFRYKQLRNKTSKKSKIK